MALTNLSLVSQALQTLVSVSIKNSSAWSITMMGDPQVSLAPVDRLGDQPAISLYLIHITEDPYFKSTPSDGMDVPSVSRTPMGLNLTYQLTAITTQQASGVDYGTATSQLLFGLALKALRDIPSIGDDTVLADPSIPGSFIHVMPDDLRGHGNRIRIELLPVSHADAAQLWTGQDRPARLAAYYVVSVVMLEPEVVKVRASRVLRYGLDVLIAGDPQLTGSVSTISYTIPGGPTRTATIQPAEAVPAPPLPWPSPPADPAINSRVTFTGVNLAADATALYVRGPTSLTPIESAWTLTAVDTAVTAIVAQTAGTSASQIDIVPGPHAGTIGVRRTVGTGLDARRIEFTSNAMPFMVAPRLDPPSWAGSVLIVTGYLFQHAAIPPGGVEVFFAGTQLDQQTGSGPPSAGRFVITGPNQIRLQPATPPVGGPTPLSIRVNGATCPPVWAP
jgi:hypothetical protein